MMKNKPTNELKFVRHMRGITLKQKWTDGEWYEVPHEDNEELKEYKKNNSFTTEHKWRGSYVFPTDG